MNYNELTIALSNKGYTFSIDEFIMEGISCNVHGDYIIKYTSTLYKNDKIISTVTRIGCSNKSNSIRSDMLVNSAASVGINNIEK